MFDVDTCVAATGQYLRKVFVRGKITIGLHAATLLLQVTMRTTEGAVAFAQIGDTGTGPHRHKAAAARCARIKKILILDGVESAHVVSRKSWNRWTSAGAKHNLSRRVEPKWLCVFR